MIAYFRPTDTASVVKLRKASGLSQRPKSSFYHNLSSLIAAAIAERSLLSTALAERLNPSIFPSRGYLAATMALLATMFLHMVDSWIRLEEDETPYGLSWASQECTGALKDGMRAL
jgi:hypothetical protein